MEFLVEVKANQTNDTYKLGINKDKQFVMEFTQYDNGTDKEPTEQWVHVLSSALYEDAVVEFFGIVAVDIEHFAKEVIE